MQRLRRVAMVAVLVAACGGDGSSGSVLVSAASSLTDAFGALETAYETANPGVDIVLNLAASSTLGEQILEGAPVDVFASADANSMERVAGLIGEQTVFARNQIVIAVPEGNPAGVTGLDDFGRDELLLGVCVPTAPCGALALEAFGRHGIDAAIDTQEPNVRSVLTKVVAGELDAGIVYLTDLVGSSAEGVPIEDAPSTDYLIAIVTGGSGAEGGTAFVSFVLSDEGRAVLAEYGFGSP